MFLALPALIVPFIYSTKAEQFIAADTPGNTWNEFLETYRKSLTTYGVISGTCFITVSVILLIMFWMIFRLIDDTQKLSDTL